MLTWAVVTWYRSNPYYKPEGFLLFVALLCDVDLTANLIKAVL